MSAPFEVADRVRVVHAGWTGSVVEVELSDDVPPTATVHVLLDGQGISGAFHVDELEPYDGPASPAPPLGPAHPVPPARPVRDGLPGVGDALLNVAAVLGAQLPDNPAVLAKLGELEAAVEAAMPPTEVRDDEGNGWVRCGPLCDLRVVETGRTECSGAGGCVK